MEHDIVSALKQLSAELGRIPTREEFFSGRYKRQIVDKTFGGWTRLKEAAGLSENSREIDDSVFNKDIEKHLENYEPVKIKFHKPYPTIAVCSDRHEPFSHKIGIKRFIEFVGDMKPEYVVDNGDGEDFLAHSKFARSLNNFTPQQERNLSLKNTMEFWEQIAKVSPDSKRFMTWGNHQLRPLKRVLETYPEAQSWVEEGLKRDYSFPGVTVIFDQRQELIIDNIAILHGYQTKLGAHRDFTLMNCITGHSHVGGVLYRQTRGETLWELNCGLLGDQNAKGLQYTNQTMQKWTLGWGYVDKLGPRFIPL